jgi:HlyD family secretion protein
MKKWKWIAAALATIILLTANLLVFDKKETTAIEAPRLKTNLSKEQDFIKKWEVTGFAHSKNTIDIYRDSSFGELKEILVDSGETVTTGQTLVTYQNPELEKELRELKREKEAADVRSEYYSDQISDWESELSSYDEDEDGAEAKVLLQEKLAEAELQAALAEKESKILFDEIMEIEKKKDELSTKSPTDGIVANINVNSEEAPLLMIIGQGNFELEASIQEELARTVKIGDSVQVAAPDSKKNLRGTVQNMLPGKTEHTYTVTVLAEDEYVWMEGKSAKIIFSESLSSNAVSVPVQSILKENGKEFVFIISKNKLYKKNVTTGFIQHGQTEIKEGLKKNEAVVLNPSPVFVSGKPAIDINKK